MSEDEKYMKEAIRQAKKAYALEEVPIGCVIVQNGKIIARGYNRRNTDKNTLAHAELTAIKKAEVHTLADIPGISRTDAENIYAYYRQGEKMFPKEDERR